MEAAEPLLPPPPSSPWADADLDDFPSGLCTPVTVGQDHADDDDHDSDTGSFQLFDVGDPWTQAAPSTQFQRKQWLRDWKGGLASSDPVDDVQQCVQSPPKEKKRRRLVSSSLAIESSDCEEAREPDVDSTDVLAATTTTDEPSTALQSSKRPRPKARPSMRAASLVSGEEEEVSATQLFRHHRSSRRLTGSAGGQEEEDARERVNHHSERSASVDQRTACADSLPSAESLATVDPRGSANHTPSPLSATPTHTTSIRLSAADEEALQSVIADLEEEQAAETSSSDFEILETPPVNARRHRGLARMLSDLPAEKKKGYWSQFDDYVASQAHDASTHNDDSRLLPNRFVPVSEHDMTSSNSQHESPHSAADHMATPIRRRPHPAIERMDDAHSPGTLIARSRNATGMGLATKTWESTWKARGVRVVKGRIVRQPHEHGVALDSPCAGRGRGQGRGRGRATGRGRGRGS